MNAKEKHKECYLEDNRMSSKKRKKRAKQACQTLESKSSRPRDALGVQTYPPLGRPFSSSTACYGSSSCQTQRSCKEKKKGPSTGGGVPKRQGDLTCPSAQGVLQSIQDVDSPGPRLTKKPEMPECACAEVVCARAPVSSGQIFLRAPKRHFRRGSWSGRMYTCPAGDGPGAGLKCPNAHARKQVGARALGSSAQIFTTARRRHFRHGAACLCACADWRGRSGRMRSYTLRIRP